MTATIHDLIDRWNSDEGKPYKGKLIDIEAYRADEPDKFGCMCAQGQVLHRLGGWSVDDLHDSSQSIADRETAKLLNISIAHAVLLRNINDGVDGAPSIVLTHPEKVLGDQAAVLLSFWRHMDGMEPAALDAAWAAAWAAARVAARDAAWAAARDAAWAAAGAAARDAAWAAAGCAAGYASYEIQGANVLRERGQPFFFLPMFGFATPDDIPLLPSDYGILGGSRSAGRE